MSNTADNLLNDAAHAAGLDFDAALTRADINRIDQEWPQSYAAQRRVALALMTRCKADLIGEPSPDSLDTLLDMVEAVQEWSAYLRSMVELADAAHARATAAALSIVNAHPEWADTKAASQ